MTAVYDYDAAFFAGRSETVTASATATVPWVIDLLHPKSVLDIGCGQGEWLDAFEACGVPILIGVDIAAPDQFGLIRHDLTDPLDLRTHFDLVVSLEVGEHLPAAAADIYLDTLTRHSDTILFSAANVGQEGKGHINCQPPDYWWRRFAMRGYQRSDPFRPLLAGDQRVSAWYRDNIYLFESTR